MGGGNFDAMKSGERAHDDRVVYAAREAHDAIVGNPETVREAMEGHVREIEKVKKELEAHPAMVRSIYDGMKEHPEDANGIRILGDKGFMEANGPRPSCPYGNCNHVLGPHDVVGTTFYIACNMMLAFTLFFFVQVTVVPKRWKTSVSVAGLVTGIAWYNYTYMKDQWVEKQISPTQFRYTDWLITVPLQIVEFYFILKASGPVNSSLGMRMFTTSVLMVLFGWLGEINLMAKLMSFVLGCACWLYICYETFAGEASGCAAKMQNAASRQAFGTLRVIVSLGWSIYPIGFAIAYLCFFDQPAGDLSGLAMAALNVTYNLADLVNKGAFGLAVWSAAIADK
jgi:bacteriorhodopsin